MCTPHMPFLYPPTKPPTPAGAMQIGARASCPRITHQQSPTNPTHDPKVPTDLKVLKVLKVLPLLHTHQKEGKMPSLRPPPPTRSEGFQPSYSNPQDRRHPQTFLLRKRPTDDDLIPHSSFPIPHSRRQAHIDILEPSTS